ncbi:MAG: toprim domain-containing protein [Cyanobacteria bacterium RUI128]|nr:toprim domain-containing protein [Cyanobacteria bacterium RUI128]
MEYQDKLKKLGITLTKSGKQTCPWCSADRKNKDDKCLSVTYTDTAVLYNCHHCGKNGVVYYRSKYEKKRNYKKPEEPKRAENTNPLIKYFEKRGISEKTLIEYKIGINDKKEIIFPYYKNGELTNVKYRTNLGNGKKTFRQEKDAESTLFGMDNVKDTDTLIWVEGEVDVLSLAEVGINAVSVPQGAQEKKLECIENCYEFVDRFKEHVIAVDNDANGDILKQTLLDRLGKLNCKIVNWKQYKDANDVLVAGDNLTEFIENAETLSPKGIISYYDQLDEICNYVYGKDENFYSTGWANLDNLIKLRTGYMMIVTGYPSRGKSTFVDNLLINLSKQYGLRHLVASFESTIATRYITLLEMYTQKPFYKLKQDDEILGDNYDFINDHFYSFDIDRLWTVDEICEETELAIKRYGIKTLVIDPYNRLNNKFTNNREDLYIGQMLAKLSMLAKKLDILIIFVAHPRKPDGEKSPSLYSISGSGDWYNMADYGIIVHRSRETNGKLSNYPFVFVEKVKNFFLGKPSGGEISLHYDITKRVLECGWNMNGGKDC